jgi:hypothetical protein
MFLKWMAGYFPLRERNPRPRFAAFCGSPFDDGHVRLAFETLAGLSESGTADFS